MPTLEISKKDLEGLVGKNFSSQELADALLFVKGEIGKIEGDKLFVDIKETNRPDLWSTEGIARELKARLGIKKSFQEMRFEKPELEIIVDSNSTLARPIAGAAVVKNVKISQEFLEQIIQLQEKISQTFGRKRKEAAMGIYELDKIMPPIYYKGFLPNEKKFVPLGFEKEMTLQEILEMHPKGKEFRHLLEGAKKFPVWIDSKGTILSMPPIINSEITGRVNTHSKNVFIEVTGHNFETVNTALLVLAGQFLERDFKVQKVKIKNVKKSFFTPQFESKKTTVDFDYAQKIIGQNISKTQALELLTTSGYKAKMKGKKIEAFYPNYRKDILHQIDAIEDMLVSIQFSKIALQKTSLPVTGKMLDLTRLEQNAREACIGLGLQEVLTFTLTSKEKQEKKTGLKNEEFAEIKNPLSANYEIFRKRLFPELLEFLSKNKKSSFPQKIFEIGKTIQLDSTQDTGVKEKLCLCIAISGKNSEFTLAKSLLEAYCSHFGFKTKYVESTLPFLEKGKSAFAETNGKKGFFGEISGKTMQEFKIEEKTIIIEIELE